MNKDTPLVDPLTKLRTGRYGKKLKSGSRCVPRASESLALDAASFPLTVAGCEMVDVAQCLD